MSDFDDAIGDATTDLLTEAGLSCVYHRGSESTSITLRKSTQQPFVVENGVGNLTEVRPVDFIGLTSTFPYTEPLAGDKIVTGGEWFEVNAVVTEKCFRKISPKMIRIHTKLVK